MGERLMNDDEVEMIWKKGICVVRLAERTERGVLAEVRS
jgi:hypothetical protein